MSAHESDRIDHAAVEKYVGEAIRGLDIYAADQSIPDLTPTPIHRIRRAGPSRLADNIDSMSLVEEDGILRWRSGFGFRPRTGRRSGRRGQGIQGRVIAQLKFESLEKNRIGEALTALDAKLTPNQGMRRWTSATKAVKEDHPSPKGRILLIVHGTFSNTENLLAGLQVTPEGRDFLGAAFATYDQVLSLDHPTVSVNPYLNAVDLKRRFDGSKATVDVICHSRGGLVTRWWAEVLNDDPSRLGKLILVGAPLAGTSLAAAPKLRASMDYLTNLGTWLQRGAGVLSAGMPLLTAVTGIMRVVTTVTKVAAKTPVFDAALSAIPGLVGQGRTADNPGILKLRGGLDEGRVPPDYYVVKGEFEPDAVGWRFWRFFQNPKGRLADAGADLVFQSPNDLVVDTDSMTDLSKATRIAGANRILDFRTSNKVHHTNYFEQVETVEFLRRVLGV